MKKYTVLLAGVVGFVLTFQGSVDNAKQAVGLPDAVVDSDYGFKGDPPPDQVALGRVLFFDKVLSGNNNISCATCHHPDLATTDGVSLGFGEGASGLGPDRTAGSTSASAVFARVPRNSPALFNVGAEEFTALFHDGRVEVDPKGFYEGGFITPAKFKLWTGLESVLAAQAMFPVTSPTEMAGQKGENPIAEARSMNNVAGSNGVWEQLGERLAEIPEYVDMFRAAYPDIVTEADDISYVLAANAIAAFEVKVFRADNSPYDAYLRGATNSLDLQQLRGMELFYGKAGCATCHSGAFQTDHTYHAIAMPQLGPGKGDGGDATYWRSSGEHAFVEDFGRGHVTVRPDDNFKFRTPSLRNVELTGPWGHSGAYESLEAVVRHHLDPVGSLETYDPSAATLPRLDGVMETVASGSRWSQSWLSAERFAGYLMRDTWVQTAPELRARIAAANELDPTSVSDSEIDDLVAFLGSLTDPASRNLDQVEPDRVPSGLPVSD
jgi:cytochrome c peroxidase